MERLGRRCHLDGPERGRARHAERAPGARTAGVATPRAKTCWRRFRPRACPRHPLIQTDAATRFAMALGESFGDWIRKRFGALPPVPDGVAFPESSNQVRELLDLANANNWIVIPFAGGTSVAGHLDCPISQRPILSINLSRMNRLLHLDKHSQLATFGAGTPGPLVEAQLRAHGYTLGHFPQSFEYSTVGGWVVTRSSGQQSLRYGRIEQLFAGGHMETPVGTLTIPTLAGGQRRAGPARAGDGLGRPLWHSDRGHGAGLAACPSTRAFTPCSSARLGRRRGCRARAGAAQAALEHAAPVQRHRDRNQPHAGRPRAPDRLAAALPVLARLRRGQVHADAGRDGRHAHRAPRSARGAAPAGNARRRLHRPRHGQPSGRPTASRAPTCATRCGTRATPPTRSRPPSTGPRSSR